MSARAAIFAKAPGAAPGAMTPRGGPWRVRKSCEMDLRQAEYVEWTPENRAYHGGDAHLAEASVNEFFKSRNKGTVWNRQGAEVVLQAKAGEYEQAEGWQHISARQSSRKIFKRSKEIAKSFLAALQAG